MIRRLLKIGGSLITSCASGLDLRRGLPTFGPMTEVVAKELTLKVLRERRERLALDLASLEQGPASARELLTWRQRLAELEARIARWSHG